MSSQSKLVSILLQIYKSSRSGVLRFEQGSAKNQLFVQNGLLMFAESNHPDMHLARIMVKMGLINRNKVKEIASLMKTGKTTEEAVLAVSKMDLQSFEKGRHEQAVVIIASILGWNTYATHYYSGNSLTRQQLNLRIPLPEILLLSARRAISDRLIQFPSYPLQGTVSISEAADEQLKDLPLNDAEAYMCSIVRKPMQFESVLSHIPKGNTKPKELLLCLSVLGLIKLEEPAASKPGTPVSTSATSCIAKQLEDMRQKFEVASLYEILGIASDASHEEIQTAYHQLARQYHPDRFQSGNYSDDLRDSVEELFICITGAYATLSDPSSRQGYDATRLTRESRVEAALKARSSTDIDKNKISETLFRAGRNALAKGDYEKAVEYLKECVWLCPDTASYRLNLGIAQSEIPKLRKEAEQNLIKALEIDGTSLESYLALGKLYLKANLPIKAEIQLQEILRWDPENKEANQLLADLSRQNRPS